jgi:hypothetical protein
LLEAKAPTLLIDTVNRWRQGCQPYAPKSSTGKTLYKGTIGKTLHRSTYDLSIALQLFVGLDRFFSFLIYTIGGIPWTGNKPVTRPLHAHRTAQTQNGRTQISILQMGFEPTISVFELAKTVHALDRAAAVIGRKSDHLRHV